MRTPPRASTRSPGVSSSSDSAGPDDIAKVALFLASNAALIS
ncbi:hypothetical protein QFZ23_002396 [Arthrobacter globiformis]|nr:hypothetical protein [Arthrobacter globiformis]MDQ1058495.1 hypothetical protein [Arthrobacter globiformis]